MLSINLIDKFSKVDGYWNPKIVAEMNGQYVKIAKFKGEFIWHSHAGEDEFFQVIVVCHPRQNALALKDESTSIERRGGVSGASAFILPSHICGTACTASSHLRSVQCVDSIGIEGVEKHKQNTAMELYNFSTSFPIESLTTPDQSLVEKGACAWSTVP